jgi:NAD(P)-dependent dehydrogenase (short-subunit alcohol dehydrogenase family)/rhamnose utilization protein RhaD (predicted bifunctional aldolase and dehydrogenase)
MEIVKTKLKELVEISRFYGNDPEFVLAGGGNTSFKTADRLWVKSSGSSMARIREEDFVVMDRAALRRIWETGYSRDPDRREAEVLAALLSARAPGEEAKRPSVETSLHDLLEAPFVVHTHPALINGLACSRDGEARLAEVLGEEALWVPTVNPGYILAAAVRERVAACRARYGREPEILVLQNHGLIVTGRTAQEVRRTTERAMAALDRRIGRRPDFGEAPADRGRAARIAPALRVLLMPPAGAGPEPSIVVFRADREIAARVRDAASFAAVPTTLTPDHIVYAGAEALFVPGRPELEEQYRALREAIEGYRVRTGSTPRVIAVQGLGVFGCGSSRKTAGQALQVYRDALKVAAYAESFGGLRPLPPEQAEFIRRWEVEAYRQRVNAAAGPPARLAERIVLVTGAGQGFGQGIAEGLAAEGANVVCADLNGEAAGRNAGELCRRFGDGRALGLQADVTAEDSVRAMVERTVLEYGGLDLLVSNAGVLRAGGLEEMSLEEFESVNRVNYTGYFLGAQAAAGPMRIQNRFRPGYLTDIVQVNSKSGLAGSSRNFAYAGSKFAGIGLTQSFALELVPYGIKVNAVCPGNLFDGPLWSDPENGLFVQYLRAGKVPGAKSVEDVRRFYESKVPMGRGCRIEDVVRAVLYLVEQAYETGQALPVTGGQVMLG